MYHPIHSIISSNIHRLADSRHIVIRRILEIRRTTKDKKKNLFVKLNTIQYILSSFIDSSQIRTFALLPGSVVKTRSVCQ